MTKLDRKYRKDGFIVVAVNDWRESKDTVAGFAAKAGLEHVILLAGHEVSATQYGVKSSPTGFWIDHTGVIVRREKGFHPSLVPDMEERLQAMLERKRELPADATGATPPAGR